MAPVLDARLQEQGWTALLCLGGCRVGLHRKIQHTGGSMDNAASDSTTVHPSKIVWATNTLRAHIDGNTSSRPFAAVVAVYEGPGPGVPVYRARVFVSGPPHCLNLGDFPTESEAQAAVNAVLPLYRFTK